MRALTIALAITLLFSISGCSSDVMGPGDWTSFRAPAGVEVCSFYVVGHVTKPDGGGKNGVDVKLLWDSNRPTGYEARTDRDGHYQLGPVGRLPESYKTHIPDRVKFSKNDRVIVESLPDPGCGTDTLDVVWRWG